MERRPDQPLAANMAADTADTADTAEAANMAADTVIPKLPPVFQEDRENTVQLRIMPAMVVMHQINWQLDMFREELRAKA